MTASKHAGVSLLSGIWESVLNALPHPVMLVDGQGMVVAANDATQNFFQASMAVFRKHPLAEFVPFGSPLLTLIAQVRDRGTPVNEYRVDVGTPRIGHDHVVDLYVAPVGDLPSHVVVMLQVRGMAEKIDRQLTHRGAARSVVGLASMLAHEIKNPLSGIRGAAQLIEQWASDDDRALTRLIMDETDRIVKLVDRMEVFTDERPVEREPVNIHSVLEHVKKIAQSGFGRGVRFVEEYDPSLPPVFANKDLLVQAFLNLVKNAVEAIDDLPDGEIVLSTAYRPGIRLSVRGNHDKVRLPLEFCVRDNGAGVPDELKPHLFDPFVTTKVSGSGLGLALVAKIIGDHGGVVECDSQPRRTIFRIHMPMYTDAPTKTMRPN